MSKPWGFCGATQFAVEKEGAAKMIKRTITTSLMATMMLLIRADSWTPVTSNA